MDEQTDELTEYKGGSQNTFLDCLFQYMISLWTKTAEKRSFCTGKQTDKQTDRWMDGQMDQRTDPLIGMHS